MRGKHQKLFHKFLAVFTAFLLIFGQAIYPDSAIAMSSLNACFADVKCAVALGLDLKPLTAAPIVTSTTRTVGVEVLNAAGQVVTTTSATVSPAVAGGSVAKTIIHGATVVGAALGLYALTKPQVENLQSEAAAKYCQANPSDSVCGSFQARVRNDNAGCNLTYPFQAPFGYRVEFHPGYENFSGCGTTGISRIVILAPDGSVSRYEDGGYGQPTITPIGGQAWKDWTQEKRNAAVDLLPNSAFENAGKSGTQATIVDSIPDNAVRLKMNGEGVYELQKDPTTGDYRFAPLPSPATLDVDRSGLPDSDADGIPDVDDPDDDNDGTPDVSDPEPNNPSVPASNPSPSPSPSSSPSPLSDPTVIPSTTPIAPKQFQAENWLKHGITVFSAKFPFDMFGSIPASPGGTECPSYTFFEHTFELCPIRDILVILKYPAIIGFMIWSFQSL